MIVIKIDAKADCTLHWTLQRTSDGAWWDTEQQVWITLALEVD